MPLILNGSTGISGTDGSASTPAVQGTDTNTGLLFPAADTVSVSTGGVERMRIDSAGNVGVGTAFPGTPLDVVGVIQSRGAGGEGGHVNLLNPDNASAGAILDVSTADVTRWFTVRSNSTHQIGQLAGTGGTVQFFTVGTERMRIDASGNVGIGTSSPSDRLHAVGSVRAAGTGSSFSRINGGDGNGSSLELVRGGSSSQAAYFTQFQGTLLIKNLDSGPIIFTTTTGDVERARITSGGQLFTTIDGTSSVMADYGCRAWVNFNGVANPPTIRGSGNVSSITDNGTGSYTVNFASAMPDVNYSAQALGDHVPGVYESRASIRNGTVATGSVRIDFHNGGNAPVDVTTACVAIFR